MSFLSLYGSRRFLSIDSKLAVEYHAGPIRNYTCCWVDQFDGTLLPSISDIKPLSVKDAIDDLPFN